MALRLVNENFPLDCTYEELLSLFTMCDIERMEGILAINIESERYEFADKIKRVIAFKKSLPGSDIICPN